MLGRFLNSFTLQPQSIFARDARGDVPKSLTRCGLRAGDVPGPRQRLVRRRRTGEHHGFLQLQMLQFEKLGRRQTLVVDVRTFAFIACRGGVDVSGRAILLAADLDQGIGDRG